jgi:hypothetical protein
MNNKQLIIKAEKNDTEEMPYGALIVSFFVFIGTLAYVYFQMGI